MKKIFSIGAFALLAATLQGCAVTDQVTSSMQNFGKSETGTYISPDTMNAFIDHKTTKQEVVGAIGHPQSQQVVGSREVWNYGYTKLASFSSNVSETAVFEFDSHGVLLSHYKTKGNGLSGNALTNAARL